MGGMPGGFGGAGGMPGGMPRGFQFHASDPNDIFAQFFGYDACVTRFVTRRLTVATIRFTALAVRLAAAWAAVVAARAAAIRLRPLAAATTMTAAAAALAACPACTSSNSGQCLARDANVEEVAVQRLTTPTTMSIAVAVAAPDVRNSDRQSRRQRK